MKTKSFLTAVVYATLALAFFACSSDDSDDNSGVVVKPSQLSNKQVYLVNESWDSEDNSSIEKIGESNDNGNVFMRLYFENGEREDRTDIPVGKIQDGKLLLDSLPNLSRYSESFQKFSGRCNSEWAEQEYSSCNSTLSYPQNFYSYGDFSFRADIPGKECYLDLFMVSSGKWSGGPELVYFPASGKITGTETYTYRDDGDTRSRSYDLSLSEGLNFIYTTRENRGGIRYYNSTTTLPAGTTLEWGLECNDSGPSGPDGSLNGTWSKPPMALVISGSSIYVITNNGDAYPGSITYSGSSGLIDLGSWGSFSFSYYRSGDILNINGITGTYQGYNGDWSYGYEPPPSSSSAGTGGNSSSSETIPPTGAPINTLPLGTYINIDGAGTVSPQLSPANAHTIDMIYENNKIWSAFEFGFEFDIEELEDNWTLIAPLSGFLPSGAVAQIYTGLTTESVVSQATFTNWQQQILANIDNLEEDVPYIDLDIDKAFLVATTEDQVFIVAVNAATTAISYILLDAF